MSLLTMDEELQPIVRNVEWEEPFYSTYLGTNVDPVLRKLRVNFSSFLTPPTVFDVDVETLEKQKLKVKEVPNFDPSEYESWRELATAEDG